MFKNLCAPKSPLFPPITPFTTGHLPAQEGHSIYYEISGNPKGKPVVYCHGGPGAESKPKHRQLFDPKRYKIILFDQRGCGKSTAQDVYRANTTQDLIADMEHLRVHLKIEKWHVFGGSWGAALAAVYAQTHPKRTITLMLQSLTLCNKTSLNWGNGGGAEQLLPKEFAAYLAAVQKHSKTDISNNPEDAVSRILQNGTRTQQNAVALAFSRWHLQQMDILAGESVPEEDLPPEAAEVLTDSMKMFFHYARNAFFLKPDEILNNAKNLTMPIGMVHGQLDMCCPLILPYSLKQYAPCATLDVVAGAGHRVASDMKLAKATVVLTNKHLAIS